MLFIEDPPVRLITKYDVGSSERKTVIPRNAQVRNDFSELSILYHFPHQFLTLQEKCDYEEEIKLHISILQGLRKKA